MKNPTQWKAALLSQMKNPVEVDESILPYNLADIPYDK